MLPSSLHDLASVLDGVVVGNPVVSGLTIDSRVVAEGDLFVALTARRDGHNLSQMRRKTVHLRLSCQSRQQFYRRFVSKIPSMQ